MGSQTYRNQMLDIWGVLATFALCRDQCTLHIGAAWKALLNTWENIRKKSALVSNCTVYLNAFLKFFFLNGFNGVINKLWKGNISTFPPPATTMHETGQVSPTQGLEKVGGKSNKSNSPAWNRTDNGKTFLYFVWKQPKLTHLPRSSVKTKSFHGFFSARDDNSAGNGACKV